MPMSRAKLESQDIPGNNQSCFLDTFVSSVRHTSTDCVEVNQCFLPGTGIQTGLASNHVNVQVEREFLGHNSST